MFLKLFSKSVASVKLPGHSAVYQKLFEPAGSNTFRPPNSLRKERIRPRASEHSILSNVMMVIMALTTTFLRRHCFGWLWLRTIQVICWDRGRPARNEREARKQEGHI